MVWGVEIANESCFNCLEEDLTRAAIGANDKRPGFILNSHIIVPLFLWCPNSVLPVAPVAFSICKKSSVGLMPRADNTQKA